MPYTLLTCTAGEISAAVWPGVAVVWSWGVAACKGGTQVVARSAVAEAMAAVLTEELAAVAKAEAEAGVRSEEHRVARVANPAAHIASRSNQSCSGKYLRVYRISQWATRIQLNTHHSAASPPDHNDHRECRCCCHSSQVSSQSSSS